MKRTFSCVLRKPLNPCPTHTQRHRSPCEKRSRPGLKLVLWCGTYKGIF
ncbi:hypothetical protein Zm00014a_012509 [Zea mays]|uniref:Uncharacterized protein n=1 Tax=Zea mays TaxID=4577 RepID=A0A3L6ETP2_MAIZE|nr:hypothetical protein Zm00014a_012509 [Zea mays]